MHDRSPGRGAEPLESLKQRAIRRARIALGRFGNGTAHVVLKARGENRCRHFVVALSCGAASVEEAPA